MYAFFVSTLLVSVSLLQNGVTMAALDDKKLKVLETRALQEDGESSKEIVTKFIKAVFEDFDVEAADALLGPDYIQHNPTIETGRDAILGFIPFFEEVKLKTKTLRVLADGDLVVAHSLYRNADAFGAPTLVGFDIFRVEDGKVNEHWDNLQPLEGPNPSNRTMVGGRKRIKNVPMEETMRNKELVTEFIEVGFIGGSFSNITDYISAKTYKQHNPNFGDGVEGLAAAAASGNLPFSYSTLHIVIADGDFVLTAAEGTLLGEPTAFFDLFRLRKGKIVEHWDVIEGIPPPDDFVHENGKF